MNIKNTIALSVQEAVELLTKLADSLEKNGEFAFDLRGQEVSIEAGPELLAQLNIKLDEFSIIFKWDHQSRQQAEDWRTMSEETASSAVEEEPTGYTPYIKEVKLPDEMEEKPTPKIMTIPEPSSSPSPAPSRRALPTRAQLNTTTLPREAGYWESAFKSEEQSQWTPLQIDSELENKKWASQDQLTTFSDITPTPAKPKKHRARKSGDEDLFSELDELNENTALKSKQEKPKKAAAKPVSPIYTIPTPKAEVATEEVLEWKEPSPEENVTDDDWVKPSQFLKNKGEKLKPKGRAIDTIPVPKKEVEDEVIEWKEPSPEDNVTDDDWVKPSQFLKQKAKSSSKDKIATIPSPKDKLASIPTPKEDIVRKKSRPPPKAPDSDKKKKKKGWASWD